MRNINPAAIIQESVSDFAASLAQTLSHSVTPARYATAVSCALESWPQALHDLSYPSQSVEMTQDEIVLMGKLWGEAHLPFEKYTTAKEAWAAADDIIANATYRTSNGNDMPLRDIPSFANLERRADASIRSFQENIREAVTELGHPEMRTDPFFRLGTASPKDSPFMAVDGGRVTSGAQAMLMLLTSTRGLAQVANDEIMQQAHFMATDVGSPEYAKYDPKRREEALAIPEHYTNLWFRVYQDFKPHEEFRCMMKAGKFIGGTQYHQIISDPKGRYFRADPFPELVEHGAEYEKLILDWFPKFKEASHMQDAVFDVIVNRERKSVTLIEINPLAERTFPGLMNWNQPETFNGEVQWVTETIEHTAPRISAQDLERIKAVVSINQPPSAYDSLIPKSLTKSHTESNETNVVQKVIGKIFGRGGQ